MLGPQKFWVQNFQVQKNIGNKKIWFKENWVQKFLGLKNLSSLKEFLVQKKCSLQTIFRLNNFVPKQIKIGYEKVLV